MLIRFLAFFYGPGVVGLTRKARALTNSSVRAPPYAVKSMFTFLQASGTGSAPHTPLSHPLRRSISVCLLKYIWTTHIETKPLFPGFPLRQCLCRAI